MPLAKGKSRQQCLALTGQMESTMSKPKQDMEDERQDKYLTAEVRKTQERNKVRGVKSHQPSTANAPYGAEQ